MSESLKPKLPITGTVDTNGNPILVDADGMPVESFIHHQHNGFISGINLDEPEDSMPRKDNPEE
jgi:hypothetical protein